jgi:hypothetical protein
MALAGRRGADALGGPVCFFLGIKERVLLAGDGGKWPSTTSRGGIFAATKHHAQSAKSTQSQRSATPAERRQ